MTFDDWDDYRRKVVLPLGYRNESPGCWVRRDADGREVDEFLPFTWRDGKPRWRRLVELGLGPDGRPIKEAT